MRQRLLERGFLPPAVDSAVGRLTDTGALDDRRAARACARTLAIVKRRGRLRVLRELDRLGFDADTAGAAVSDVLDDDTERQAAERILAARLRGSKTPPDAAARRRLFAALLRQGFPSDLIRDLLRRRQADVGDDSPD